MISNAFKIHSKNYFEQHFLQFKLQLKWIVNVYVHATYDHDNNLKSAYKEQDEVEDKYEEELDIDTHAC